MPRPLQWLERHRHVLLLGTAIAGLAVQPVVRWPTGGPLVYELVGYTLLVAVFLSIFTEPRERLIGIVLGIPALVANVVEHSSSDGTHLVAALVYHGFSVLFIGLAIGIILRGVFRRGRIGYDEIAGACAGYVLAGIVWGNLYVMIDLLIDDAFQIPDGLAWQLERDDTRRSLFNYFSFATLTTMGYGDVTPRAPGACTLAWLEAMFGQYYLAILIGQLMGIRMAQLQHAAPTADAASRRHKT